MEKLRLNEQEVIKKYEELKSIQKVAKYFKVSISPIKRILFDNEIFLSNRRYSFDKTFFDNIDSEEKAYWLGFIYADGYIRERKSGNSLEMKLAEKDNSHLILFRSHIKSTHKITYGTNKVKYNGGISESKICHLAIYSYEIVDSIKKQGVHSRKTFTIGKPNIGDEFTGHFIRGYFDGDGSFSFNPSKFINKTQIVSASEEFRNFLIDELKKNNITINLYSEIKLQIQNKVDNLKFYNYIYRNATVYLERKKEKYEEFRNYYKYDN
jgi:intein-encoded DNA endonuclease-like protein